MEYFYKMEETIIIPKKHIQEQNAICKKTHININNAYIYK